MKILYDEILRRFPEIRGDFNQGDKELPYLVMGQLPGWLKGLSNEAFTPELLARLVSFTKWCEEQPRGKDASDDLYTILVVGFYEPLFDSDTTRPLLPRFISRDQFIASAAYLKAWFGADNYDKASKYFTSNT